MKTIEITAEEMFINETGFYIVGCDGQDYEIKRCRCNKCHDTRGGK